MNGNELTLARIEALNYFHRATRGRGNTLYILKSVMRNKSVMVLVGRKDIEESLHKSFDRLVANRFKFKKVIDFIIRRKYKLMTTVVDRDFSFKARGMQWPVVMDLSVIALLGEDSDSFKPQFKKR